jgi:hypothetical protein
VGGGEESGGRRSEGREEVEVEEDSWILMWSGGEGGDVVVLIRRAQRAYGLSTPISRRKLSLRGFEYIFLETEMLPREWSH